MERRYASAWKHGYIMKIKKLFSVFLSVIICAALTSVTAFAENADKVADNADLLSDSEEKRLESDIMDIIEKYNYGYDIVVVTVNSTQGKSPEAFADDYYDYNGYGYDSEGSGLLLLVDMGNRKWHISTKGKGIRAFTDYGIDCIGETVADGLGSGDYCGAFSDFISLSDKYINKYETDGKPYDIGDKPKNYAVIFLISAGIGLIAAFIVCFAMKSQLKTAVRQVNARSYISKGSMNIKYARDIFLYRNVTAAKIESSDGGGSSTHTSSSGSTHGGGGGSF